MFLPRRFAVNGIKGRVLTGKSILRRRFMKRVVLIALLSFAALLGAAAEQGHPAYSSVAGTEPALSRQHLGQAADGVEFFFPGRLGAEAAAQAAPVFSPAVSETPPGIAGGGTALERWRGGGMDNYLIALNGCGVLKPDKAPNYVMRC
jgi:hypothetical protein